MMIGSIALPLFGHELLTILDSKWLKGRGTRFILSSDWGESSASRRLLRHHEGQPTRGNGGWPFRLLIDS